MKITTIQIVLDVVHGDDVDPVEVARHAGDIAHDSIVWTEWPELANTLDVAYASGGQGVDVVSATVLATRDYESGGDGEGERKESRDSGDLS